MFHADLASKNRMVNQPNMQNESLKWRLSNLVNYFVPMRLAIDCRFGKWKSKGKVSQISLKLAEGVAKMKIVDIVVVVIANMFLSSCSNSTSSEENDDSKVYSYQGIIGNVSFDFVDITSATIRIGPENITANIVLKNIPDSLVYNHTALDHNYLEYEYVVGIDVNGDKRADYEIAMEKWKTPNSTEAVGSLNSFSQKNLWKINSDGSWSNISDIPGNVNSSTITLICPLAIDSNLSKIQSSSIIYIKSYYNNGEVISKDSICP